MSAVALEVNYATDITFCGTYRLAGTAERLHAVQNKKGHGGYDRQGGVS